MFKYYLYKYNIQYKIVSKCEINYLINYNIFIRLNEEKQ